MYSENITGYQQKESTPTPLSTEKVKDIIINNEQFWQDIGGEKASEEDNQKARQVFTKLNEFKKIQVAGLNQSDIDELKSQLHDMYRTKEGIRKLVRDPETINQFENLYWQVVNAVFEFEVRKQAQILGLEVNPVQIKLNCFDLLYMPFEGKLEQFPAIHDTVKNLIILPDKLSINTDLEKQKALQTVINYALQLTNAYLISIKFTPQQLKEYEIAKRAQEQRNKTKAA